jgi:uncharacterized membrane protein
VAAIPSARGSDSRHFARKLARIGQLLLIAYAIHFSNPFKNGWGNALGHIDILQCIGVSMLLGFALHRAGNAAVALCACCFVFAAPQMSLWNHTALPPLLAGYVNRQNGSLFPLFPWAGFFLAGWVCNRFRWRQCLIGALLCWMGVWLQQFTPVFYPTHDYYLAGPGFFFERLGWLLLGVAICQAIPFNQVTSSPAKRLLLNAGKSSLAIYLIHLQAIYWVTVAITKPGGPPAPFGLPESLAILIAVATFTLACSHLLSTWRKKTNGVEAA